MLAIDSLFDLSAGEIVPHNIAFEGQNAMSFESMDRMLKALKAQQDTPMGRLLIAAQQHMAQHIKASWARDHGGMRFRWQSLFVQTTEAAYELIKRNTPPETPDLFWVYLFLGTR
jgi:predicted lipoprotein